MSLERGALLLPAAAACVIFGRFFIYRRKLLVGSVFVFTFLVSFLVLLYYDLVGVEIAVELF